VKRVCKREMMGRKRERKRERERVRENGGGQFLIKDSFI
jgi:hypothetical protein